MKELSEQEQRTNFDGVNTCEDNCGSSYGNDYRLPVRGSANRSGIAIFEWFDAIILHKVRQERKIVTTIKVFVRAGRNLHIFFKPQIQKYGQRNSSRTNQ